MNIECVVPARGTTYFPASSSVSPYPSSCLIRAFHPLTYFPSCVRTKESADVVKAPLIAESPVNIECVVEERKALGTHDMFLAEVLGVSVDGQFLDKKGKFHLKITQPPFKLLVFQLQIHHLADPL